MSDVPTGRGMLQCNMAGPMNVTNCNGGNFPGRRASNHYRSNKRNGHTKQLQIDGNFTRYATSNAYQVMNHRTDRAASR